MPDAPADPEAIPPTDPLPAGRPRTRAVLWIVAAAGLIAAYAPNLGELVRTWYTEPDYSHGFLVPFVALAIARRHVDGPSARPWWPGLALLAAVLAARSWCFRAGEYWTETATLLPATAAVVLAVGGLPALRRTWPAIAFLGFMFTIPKAIDARISQPLQGIASDASGKILRLSGLWVLQEGNVLDLGAGRLEVATACNGLAMLMSFSATVAAIVLLVPMSRWKQGALLLSALPIAILCNVLRIVVTAYCYEKFGSETGRKFAHDVAGWMMMPLALAMIGAELAWFSWVFRRGEPAPTTPSAPPLPMMVAR